MNRMIRPSALDHFLEHRLEPLLKLTAKLRARDQRPQIKRDQPAVLQAFGNVVRNDPLRQPLDNSRLPDARLADQARIVLRPPAKAPAPPAGSSASRPITGSILPFFASPTRSRPYRSSAWYLSSGV